MICATLKRALVFLFGCCKYMCTVLMSDCNILAFSNECALSVNVRNEGENMCLLGECFHWDPQSAQTTCLAKTGFLKKGCWEDRSQQAKVCI